MRSSFLAAGCAEGVDAWDLRSVAGEVTTDKFLPRLTEEERDVRWVGYASYNGYWLLDSIQQRLAFVYS